MEPRVKKVKEDGEKLRVKSQEPATTNLKQSQSLLQHQWEHIKTRAADRKVFIITTRFRT